MSTSPPTASVQSVDRRQEVTETRSSKTQRDIVLKSVRVVSIVCLWINTSLVTHPVLGWVMLTVGPEWAGYCGEGRRVGFVYPVW